MILCKKILLLLFLIPVFIDCEPNKLEDGKLIFAHVIYRHGDRTPIYPYPKDPWRNVSFWPVEWEQLTNTGKQQHYKLGQWLRQRYSELTSKSYSAEEIYVQSTDVDRTIMSALANLAGFYPPEGKQIWNEQINWQPIPVHTTPQNEDYILAAKKPCKAYDVAIKKLKNSDEFRRLDRELRRFYKYLTVNTGRKIYSLKDVYIIYNCLFIEELYNKTLPDWTKEVYPDKLKWVSARSFAMATYNQELARLSYGPLLKEMLDRFRDKTRNELKPDRSLWIYSGHDSTIASILNTLGLFEYHNPPYTACVMLELRLFEKTPYISIFYKNTTETPKAMYIPNCGTICKLDRMYELYKNVIPENWENECKLSIFSMTYEDVDLQPTLIVISCGSISIVLILVVLSCITIYRRRDYENSKRYLRIDS